MGWEVGYDEQWKRDIGYGVPAICDYPDCGKEIDRGLSHVCGGGAFGGDEGCGLFFCCDHLLLEGQCLQLCERCAHGHDAFFAKPDHPTWIRHKLTDESWQPWRDENPQEVERLQKALAALAVQETRVTRPGRDAERRART